MAREAKEKAKKEAVVKLELEKVEGSKKHSHEECKISVTIGSFVGSFMTEHRVEWMVQSILGIHITKLISPSYTIRQPRISILACG